jgi:hypothetical protein
MVGTERGEGGYVWWEQREGGGVYMVGKERVRGCIYGGNREE